MQFLPIIPVWIAVRSNARIGSPFLRSSVYVVNDFRPILRPVTGVSIQTEKYRAPTGDLKLTC